MDTTLIIMAAGIGSRYGAGIKQLAKMGPNGEIIMDYSIRDGHGYYVNSGVDYLREHALEYGYDVVMYGHTHVPYIEIGDDVTILNPGSISYPRQPGRKPTFLIMEIDEEGQAHYAHGYYKEQFDELML